MKKDYKHPRFKAVELKEERYLLAPSDVDMSSASVNGGSGNHAASFFNLEGESSNEEDFDFD